MFNISAQNVNFVPGGPKKTGTLCMPYLHTPLLHKILTDFQIYYTV